MLILLWTPRNITPLPGTENSPRNNPTRPYHPQFTIYMPVSLTYACFYSIMRDSRPESHDSAYSGSRPGTSARGSVDQEPGMSHLEALSYSEIERQAVAYNVDPNLLPAAWWNSICSAYVSARGFQYLRL